MRFQKLLIIVFAVQPTASGSSVVAPHGARQVVSDYRRILEFVHKSFTGLPKDESNALADETRELLNQLRTVQSNKPTIEAKGGLILPESYLSAISK